VRDQVRNQVAEFVVFFGAFALALFVPAGTLAWPAGWIFFLLFMGFYVGVTVWLYKQDPGLMEERLHLETSDQQGWDKLLFPLLLLFPFLWMIFMALDAERYHWSPVPIWIQGLGAALLLFSFYLIFVAFRENSYASPVVRVQSDRGQTVVSSGPYHYVRHPMYSGIVVFSVATPLLLGAWYGVPVAGFFIALLARRAVLEERTLRAKLPGYAAYMAEIRYRFIPHVW
jgi:protein-S-isoprenylcysteine O-methyltransferase Ste14